MQHGVPRASASTEPRSEESRQKELKAIEDYQNLVEKVNEKVPLLLHIRSLCVLIHNITPTSFCVPHI